MSVLSYKLANCKNCYKCLRECSVKAISMLNGHAVIIDDQCVLCGRCTNVCPQNAKFVINTISNVQKLINSGEEVIVSLAPSYISNFPITKLETMRQALKKLGFSDVYETAEGAKFVDEEYKKILDINKFPLFITSCCPTINKLIEKHYPEALPYLAPVITPMVAHGKMIKSKHSNAKVVFIGPCIAKKDEALNSGVIDEVLTFQELEHMLNESGVNLEELDKVTIDTNKYSNTARFYPVARGVIKSIGYCNDDYDFLSVTGIDKCIEVLKNIKDLHGLFIEMNACEYGCVNGPCIIKKPGGPIKSTEVVRKYTKLSGGEELSVKEYNFNSETTFKNDKKALRIPDKIEMRAILNSFGKYTAEDELNCGACGYPTCRDKAIAIYNKMSEKEMCLPYMKEQAESLSNQIIRFSPNGIVTISKENIVLECNSRAKELLGITLDNPCKRFASDIIELQPVLQNLMLKDMLNYKTHISKTGRDVVISSVFVEKQQMYFSIIMDVTEDEKNRKKILEMKENTIELTNKVIEKQMRTVQEIASLLGETTAETKIAIYNLRKVMLDNKGDN